MTCDCTHAIVRPASAIPDGFNSYSGLMASEFRVCPLERLDSLSTQSQNFRPYERGGLVKTSLQPGDELHSRLVLLNRCVLVRFEMGISTQPAQAS